MDPTGSKQNSFKFQLPDHSSDRFPRQVVVVAAATEHLQESDSKNPHVPVPTEII